MKPLLAEKETACGREQEAVLARQLSKDLGEHRVLHSVAFSLLAGQFALLLGPNGAGKSTLLALLGLRLRPSRGQLFLFGKEAGKAPVQARRWVGMIAHASWIYPYLTAIENLQLAAHLWGLPKRRWATSAVEDVLEQVGLGRVARQPAEHFSRGMAQRLAIARLLLLDPPLWLLDEPYEGLDAGAEALLDSLIEEKRTRQGTLVLVSHSYHACMRRADRILLLEHGRLTLDQSTSGVDEAAFRALHERWGEFP
ncbi:MAG: ATP-binding cassette domain-containing protein [Firmicutes bacterium]|nr:ATP-binding cassette domain-containing protein [Bacillota bacterium]